MKPIVVVLFALATLAGCERDEAASAGGGATSAPAGQTANTPANIGPPQSQAEKREGANPVQEQVDPKQPEQHRDFRMQGDGAGPRGPDTEPKPGS